MSENYDFIAIFRILTNLEQSRGQIPDTESAKVMFLVIVAFCFTKTENTTKRSLIQLSHYCFFYHLFILGIKTILQIYKIWLIKAKLKKKE